MKTFAGDLYDLRDWWDPLIITFRRRIRWSGWDYQQEKRAIAGGAYYWRRKPSKETQLNEGLQSTEEKSFPVPSETMSGIASALPDHGSDYSAVQEGMTLLYCQHHTTAPSTAEPIRWHWTVWLPMCWWTHQPPDNDVSSVRLHFSKVESRNHVDFRVNVKQAKDLSLRQKVSFASVCRPVSWQWIILAAVLKLMVQNTAPVLWKLLQAYVSAVGWRTAITFVSGVLEWMFQNT